MSVNEKVLALLAKLEEEAAHLEATVLTDVKALAEKVKGLVHKADDTANVVAADAVKVADQVEADTQVVHVNSADTASAVEHN